LTLILRFLLFEPGFCDWKEECALEQRLLAVLTDGRIAVWENIASGTTIKRKSMEGTDEGYLIFLLRQLSQARWVFVRFLLSLVVAAP